MIKQDHLLTLLDYSPEEILELIDLSKKLKEEKDPLKKAKISQDIMNLRKGVRNGTRD